MGWTTTVMRWYSQGVFGKDVVEKKSTSTTKKIGQWRNDGLDLYAQRLEKSYANLSAVKVTSARYDVNFAAALWIEAFNYYKSMKEMAEASRSHVAINDKAETEDTAEWGNAIGAYIAKVDLSWDAPPNIKTYWTQIKYFREHTGKLGIITFSDLLLVPNLVTVLGRLRANFNEFRDLLAKKNKKNSEAEAYKIAAAIDKVNPFAKFRPRDAGRSASDVFVGAMGGLGKGVGAALGGLMTKPVLILGAVGAGGYAVYKLISNKYRDPNVKTSAVQYKR